MQEKGPDLEEVLQRIELSEHNKVRIAVTDIDGILRGKVVSLDKLRSIAEKGFGFCDVVFGWDMNDAAYDNVQVTGWHTGYPDAQATLAPHTYREIPWEDGLPLILADFRKAAGHLADICPRTLLHSIRQQAFDMGFNPTFSQEFEWFNFRHYQHDLFDERNAKKQPISEGMFGYSILRSSQNSEFFNALFDQLTDFDVPIEGLHTETGPGVYEAAIRYADVVEAADRAVLFKTGVKEIAMRYGVLASFMAKWNADLPGCSGHLHQSLWDDDGNNLFYNIKYDHAISQLMRHYIAGQMHCLPHILPMYAPTINSHKRLVEGAWAPTTITWGIDNRTTALRVIGGSPGSMRLETRVCGSDSNPYLAMAAALASGLYGIKHKLELSQEPVKGNGYASKGEGSLHSNLYESALAMQHSSLARELFGNAFVDHFTNTRIWEWRQYGKAVTDWELRRYFEII